MWYVGCIFSFIGTLCANLGVNCQKLSAQYESEKLKKDRRAYFKQPMWRLGITLVVLGSFGDFLGLAFAPQSLVAPIRAFTLVSNLLFAKIILHEVMHQTDVIGCVMIVIGSLIAVAFGPQETPDRTLKQLQRYFLEPAFIIYAFITGIFCTLCFYYSRKMKFIRNELEKIIENYSQSFIGQHPEAVPGLYDKAYADYEPYVTTHPFLYCALSGIMGGQSLTFAKLVAVLLRNTFKSIGNVPLLNPLFYVFLLCMVFFIVGQIHYLNEALIISDSLFVVPIFQVFFITASTCAGLIYYKEYLGFRWFNGLFFSIGMLTIITGVYVLSMRDLHNLEYDLVQETRENERLKDAQADQDDVELQERPVLKKVLSLTPVTAVKGQSISSITDFVDVSQIAPAPFSREVGYVNDFLGFGAETPNGNISRQGSKLYLESDRKFTRLALAKNSFLGSCSISLSTDRSMSAERNAADIDLEIENMRSRSRSASREDMESPGNVSVTSPPSTSHDNVSMASPSQASQTNI